MHVHLMFKHLMRLHHLLLNVKVPGMPSTREQELVTRWRTLSTSYNDLACTLDRVLQESHHIGLSEFEALDRLVESGDKCLMHTLGSEMYLSQSALSRTVARLEREGLVERAICDFDRRAIYVKPTPTGLERHAEARETHRTVLADRLA